MSYFSKAIQSLEEIKLEAKVAMINAQKALNASSKVLLTAEENLTFAKIDENKCNMQFIHVSHEGIAMDDEVKNLEQAKGMAPVVERSMQLMQEDAILRAKVKRSQHQHRVVENLEILRDTEMRVAILTDDVEKAEKDVAEKSATASKCSMDLEKITALIAHAKSAQGFGREE